MSICIYHYKIYFFILNINICIGISKLSIPELSKELITTILGFYLSILYFYLEVLINRHFLFKIIFGIFKKLSRFLFKPFFTMQLEKLSCYLTLDIIFVSYSFRGIKDNKASRCI